MSRTMPLFCLLLGISCPASAAVLDQSYVPTNGPFGVPPRLADVGDSVTDVEVAQSFTVGVSGRLTEADVYLTQEHNGNLLLEIRRTLPNGLPSEAPGDLLAAAITSPSVQPASYVFAPSFFNNQGPLVTAGEQLALVLRVPGVGSYGWGGEATNPYAGGSAAFRTSSSLNQWVQAANPGLDLGFRTYVEPVPEPSTCAVIVLGGVGLFAARVRRTRK